MFAKFDESKMSRGPSICAEIQTPENIVVFVGEAHIRVLRHLLNLMYGSELKTLINIPPKPIIEGEDPGIDYNLIKLDTPFRF